MKTREYDLIEGDESKLTLVCLKKDKSLIDLSGATDMKFFYKNAGASASKPMAAPNPTSGEMEYRFALDEIKAGDLEVSGEFKDAGGFRHTQTNAKHLKVGPRP